jgi:membrane-associated phospholipid phosphatase
MTSWHPYIRRFLTNLTVSFVLLIVLFVLCLWGLLAVADMIFEDKNFAFDMNVFQQVESLVGSRMTAFMQFITFFGSQNFLLPANIILVIIFLIVKKTKWDALKVAAISITSTIVLFSLKFFLQRERPLVPLIAKAHGYSFPSGHTFTSVTFLGMIGYICYKKIENRPLKVSLIILIILLSFLVGFSRIYLRLHFASDVIAGYCLGIIWLLLAQVVIVYKTEEK